MLKLSRLRPSSNEGYLAWVLLVVIVTFSLLTDQFLTLQNLLDLTESYAVSGIFALGLFVVLVTGGIDGAVHHRHAGDPLWPQQPGGQHFTGCRDRHRARHDQRDSDLLPAHCVDHRDHQYAVAAVRDADVADQRHQPV